MNVLQTQHLFYLHVRSLLDGFVNTPTNHAEAAQSNIHFYPSKLFNLHLKAGETPTAFCMRHKNKHPP